MKNNQFLIILIFSPSFIFHAWKSPSTMYPNPFDDVYYHQTHQRSTGTRSTSILSSIAWLGLRLMADGWCMCVSIKWISLVLPWRMFYGSTVVYIPYTSSYRHFDVNRRCATTSTSTSTGSCTASMPWGHPASTRHPFMLFVIVIIIIIVIVICNNKKEYYTSSLFLHFVLSFDSDYNRYQYCIKFYAFKWYKIFSKNLIIPIKKENSKIWNIFLIR